MLCQSHLLICDSFPSNHLHFRSALPPPPFWRGLLETKTERRSGRHMLGWDSLLSIYKRVPDSATGEMILVRRPELGGLESQSGSAAPSICGGGASAVVSAVSQFGGAPVRAAAAPTCPGGGVGPMPTLTCGAVTNATTSFHFSPAPAASPVGAATLAAGGFFFPDHRRRVWRHQRVVASSSQTRYAAQAIGHRAATVPDRERARSAAEFGRVVLPLHHQDVSLPGPQLRTPTSNPTPNLTLIPTRPNHNP